MTDTTGKLARLRKGLAKSDFDAVHPAGVIYQAADALSRRQTIGMDRSPLKQDVPVLTIFVAQPEGEETQTNGKKWHSRCGNEGLNNISLELP